jgi:ribosomal protein S18 acetylase RimI-like enzyme
MTDFTIRPLTAADCDWVKAFSIQHWGSNTMVAHGEIFLISQMPGFAAEAGAEVVGLITYHIAGNACEVTSLDSLREGSGIGTALIEVVKLEALKQGCKRLFLITTNDNLHALRFYQRRGFTLAALRANAISESRKIKPEIPLHGLDGIPIRDEIELEIRLDEA